MSSSAAGPQAAQNKGNNGKQSSSEARAAAQIQKMAENNAALARMNNRLSSQLDRLRSEHEQLQHLVAGQQAVARAKEAELAAEINGLKQLLKESLAERSSLHAQLVAKQEIVRYLEWRLAQTEQIVEAKGGSSGQLSEAFKAAAKVAAGEPPDDSFAVAPEPSVSTQSSSASGASGRNLPRTLIALGQRGLVGIPASAWAPTVAADIEKENGDGPTPRRTPRTGATTPGLGQTTQLGSIPRVALLDITPRREATAGSPPSRTPAAHARPQQEEVEQRQGRTLQIYQGEENEDEEITPQNALEEVVEAAGEEEAEDQNDSAAPPSPTEEESSDGPRKQLFVESSIHSNGIISAAEVEQQQKEVPAAEEEPRSSDSNRARPGGGASSVRTPSAQQITPFTDVEQRDGAISTPASGLRSSSRIRQRVSYRLPPVNRKLRQGDPFTFGDPVSIRKKVPRSRTKPRARFPSSAESSRRTAARSVKPLETVAATPEPEGSDNEAHN